MNRVQLLWTLTAVVLVAVIIGVMISIFMPKSVESRFEASKTVDNISNVTTINGIPPASIVVAPATETWWKSLQKYTTNEIIPTVDFSAISANSTYISHVLSRGSQYQSYDRIGLTTSFIVYKTNDDALKASEALGREIPHFAKGNVIMFIPNGAFTDVDYNLVEYLNDSDYVAENDLQLDNEAVWYFNFREFANVYTTGYDEMDASVYDNTVGLLGVAGDTEWYGTSKDGKTWEGNFTQFNVDNVNTPQSVIDYLSDQLYFISVDGETLPISEATEENQSGTIIPRQSVLTSYMIIRDNNESAGEILNSETSETQKLDPLPTDEGVVQIVLLPDEWLSFMMSETTANIVTGFERVTVTMTGGDAATIVVE